MPVWVRIGRFPSHAIERTIEYRQVCHALRYTRGPDRSRRAGRDCMGDLQSPAPVRGAPVAAARHGAFTFAWCLAKIRARCAPVGCACARESFEKAVAAWL